MVASPENLPLLAELLAEQQRLDTPVARFAVAHEHGTNPQVAALARQLLPVTRPQPGEQYAFEVDLDSCTGCKSCVAACHSLNGLDDTETWRDVSVLVSPSRARPFSQTITSACHHCADPGCLNGCPVLAYEKDPVTGIVRHLDDQCIGCSYCILKCPYDVPKYSDRLGIVRKCDMCQSRLAAGEPTACAQACPTHAIRVVIVSIETGIRIPDTGNSRIEAQERTPGTDGTAPAIGNRESDFPDRVSVVSTPEPAPASLVPGLRFPVSNESPASDRLPFPSYTRPTTRYLTRRKLPETLVAADARALRPPPSHWPLVILLSLMPAAVGLGCAAAVLRFSSLDHATHSTALFSWLAGVLGLGSSILHLGQPARAWRIFLGWKRSWLSREAVVFALWLILASGALFQPALLLPAALIGVAGLSCSAMIYVDTHRHFWRATQTFPRLFGAAALVGLALYIPLAAAGVLVLKLGLEWRTLYDDGLSARLQRGPLKRAAFVRDMLGLAGLVLLIAAPGWAPLLPLFGGEVAERYLFFRAVDAPRTPEDTL